MAPVDDQGGAVAVYNNYASQINGDNYSSGAGGADDVVSGTEGNAGG